MPKNRKNQSEGLVFGSAVKAVLICGFILVGCVGFVWQKKQIHDLSNQHRNAEKQLKDLQNRNDQLRNQVAMMLSTSALEARAKDPRLNLGLVAPQPSQIWRLPEPQADVPATRASVKLEQQQYASGRSGGPAVP